DRPPRPVEPRIERHRNARKPKAQIERDGPGLVFRKRVGRFPRTFWEDDYLTAHSRGLYCIGNQSLQGGWTGAALDSDHSELEDEPAEQRDERQLVLQHHRRIVEQRQDRKGLPQRL